MKLTYLVTEQDYVCLLENLIRKNDRRFIKRGAFLLLTVGQMAGVTALCIFRIDQGQWPFFALWSIFIAGISVLRRYTVRWRAKGTLERLKYTGQLPLDYWKPHSLRENQGELLLTYGKICVHGVCGSFREVEDDGQRLYLWAGENVFDIVPATAFSTPQEKWTFLTWMQVAFEQNTLGAKNVPKEFDEQHIAAVEFFTTAEDFGRAQVLAFRRLYLCHQIPRPISMIKLAISVGLIVNLVLAPSVLNISLSLVLLGLLNKKNLIAWTPLGRIRIQRELGAWKADGKITLLAREDGIWYSNGKQQLQILYEAIDASVDAETYRILSWGRLPAIVIPRSICETVEGQNFLEYVSEKHLFHECNNSV